VRFPDISGALWRAGKSRIIIDFLIFLVLSGVGNYRIMIDFFIFLVPSGGLKGTELCVISLYFRCALVFWKG